MKNTKSALLVGVGGQGAILTAKVLVNGLMNAGYDVKMSEVHGMSQRGGSVFCPKNGMNGWRRACASVSARSPIVAYVRF